MTRNMENGDGMVAVAEAMTIAQAYPLAEAVEPFNSYLFATDTPDELLLALYARSTELDASVSEVASVLLAIHAMDTFNIQTAKLPIRDDLLPLSFRLSTGELVSTPPKTIDVEYVVETEMPDSWNKTWPHSVEQILRRIEITQNIYAYFAEGSEERMRTETPEILEEAAEELRPITWYKRYLEQSLLFTAEVLARTDLADKRHEELAAILSADLAEDQIDVQDASTRQAVHELAHWVIDTLGRWQDILPPQQNIPRTYHLEDVSEDDTMLDTESATAAHDIDVRARWAKATLRENRTMWL